MWEYYSTVLFSYDEGTNWKKNRSRQHKAQAAKENTRLEFNCAFYNKNTPNICYEKKSPECTRVKLWAALMQPAFQTSSSSCIVIQLCSLGALGGGEGLFSC